MATDPIAPDAPWWSPVHIRSTFWRRAALVMTLPVATVVIMPVVLLLPFWAGRNAALAASEAFADTFRQDAIVLLVRGFRLIWSAKYHTDHEVALKEARREAA